MKSDKNLFPNRSNLLSIADHYEYTMAYANILNRYSNIDSVFDLIVRRMPINKIIGEFEYNGNRYKELKKRDFLINAGLEQVCDFLLNNRISKEIIDYQSKLMNLNAAEFISWMKNLRFTGDLYAMKEGTIFFEKEMQLRVHEKFEIAQIFETIILNTINPQTNVASNANDFRELTDKLLLEGGSRRGGSPQSAIYNSRASIIGGFNASSNVAYGMLYNKKVGGTHGHSYVMLHEKEIDAFYSQGKTLKEGVCFLLDTYNIENAIDSSIEVIKNLRLNHFSFRLDSGDLIEQAIYIHKVMKKEGFQKERYSIVASDEITPDRLKKLEKSNAKIDKYLVGTYAVNPLKPLGGVYKLCALKKDKEWEFISKITKDLSKATLPGIKQVYRISNKDGFYLRDIIALENEDISKYLSKDENFEKLLIPIIKSGKLVYEFPDIDEISKKRERDLKKFRKIESYKVIISDEILKMQKKIFKKHSSI